MRLMPNPLEASARLYYFTERCETFTILPAIKARAD